MGDMVDDHVFGPDPYFPTRCAITLWRLWSTGDRMICHRSEDEHTMPDPWRYPAAARTTADERGAGVEG